MDNSLLHDEHVLLGAATDEGVDGRSMPTSYPTSDVRGAFADGAALIDLTGLGSRLISGTSAEAFVNAAFTCRSLTVGEVALTAVLTGDGALASIALLARTGDREFACWDLLGRGDILFAWLGFVAGVEQGGQRAFPDVVLEDASEALVPLLLWGPQAPAVLADYLRDQELPEVGRIDGYALDDIGCLVASLPLGKGDCYLVLVPPRYARVLWRSFLSFAVVAPVAPADLLARLVEVLPHLAGLPMSMGKLTITKDELAKAGLIRDTLDFVGARGLTEG